MGARGGRQLTFASAQPKRSMLSVSKAIVSFLPHRDSKAICGCEMWSFDAPCCRVSPLNSDSSCADVLGQYLAPPATMTCVSSCQQRYGNARPVTGLIEAEANACTSMYTGLTAPSRVLGEKSSQESVPGSAQRTSSVASANSRMPSVAAASAWGAGMRRCSSSNLRLSSAARLCTASESGPLIVSSRASACASASSVFHLEK